MKINVHEWHNDILGEKAAAASKLNNFDAVY